MARTGVLVLVVSAALGCAGKPPPKAASTNDDSLYFGAAATAARAQTDAVAIASIEAIESTRENICRVMEQALRMGAAVYAEEHDACPTADEVLAANLVGEGVGVSDPWDGPFDITCAAAGPVIGSAGRDGIRGTADDVVTGP